MSAAGRVGWVAAVRDRTAGAGTAGGQIGTRAWSPRMLIRRRRLIAAGVTQARMTLHTAWPTTNAPAVSRFGPRSAAVAICRRAHERPASHSARLRTTTGYPATLREAREPVSRAVGDEARPPRLTSQL